MEQSLLEKLIVAQLVKKFPAFCETQNFITVFTNKTGNLILRQLKPIHIFASYLFKFHLNIILSPHLRLDIPTGIFPLRLPTNCCIYLPMRATCHLHPSSNYPHNNWWQLQSTEFTIMQFSPNCCYFTSFRTQNFRWWFSSSNRHKAKHH